MDTILVHCYAGQSCSRAVAAAVMEMTGGDGSAYLNGGSANSYVYEVLLATWVRRMLGAE